MFPQKLLIFLILGLSFDTEEDSLQFGDAGSNGELSSALNETEISSAIEGFCPADCNKSFYIVSK